jgi:hypothetical protein
MTQYLLSVYPYGPGTAPADEQPGDPYQDVAALNTKLQSAGAWVFAGGLEAPDTATVVRASTGQIVTTDGPFAETKEQLGGFWVIEAADLDAALDWAGQATVACGAPVEVRPFQPV